MTPQIGCEARLRGEVVRLHHVERVPRHRNLLGETVPASFRAVVSWPDGRWNNMVDLQELELVSEPA